MHIAFPALLFALFAFPLLVSALRPVYLAPHSPIGLSFSVLLCNLANAIFTIALVGAVIAFLVAAFYYLTAYGSEQRVTKAKGALTYVAFGVAVTILAWGTTLIIASTLAGGVTSITDPCG